MIDTRISAAQRFRLHHLKNEWFIIQSRHDNNNHHDENDDDNNDNEK